MISEAAQRARGLEQSLRHRISSFGWGLVDQVLSSATNFGGSVLAARALSSSDFGAAAVGFSLYLLALGISRAWSSEPLLIRYSATAPRVRSQAVARAATSSLAMGAALGASVGGVGLLLSGALRPVFFVLAVAMPFLMLQDLWRFALIMEGRQKAAALNDGLWLVVMLVAFGVADRTDISPGVAIACWSTGALAGAGLGLVQLQTRFTPQPRRWWNEHRDLGARYSLEFLLVIGVSYTLTIGVAAIGGLEDAAGLRGAQVAMGPLNVLFMGVGIQLLPLMVEQASRSSVAMLGMARLVSFALTTCALSWGLVLLLLPDSIGTALLGESWDATEPLLPVFTWMYLASAAMLGALYGLRARADARRSLRTRLGLSPLVVVAGVTGAVLGKATGAAIGLAIANTVALPVWWYALNRSIGESPLDGEINDG